MLGACAPALPPLNFTPPNVALAQHRHEAALVSTSVTIAPKSEAKGPIDIAGAESNVSQLWKAALDDALLRMAMFRDSATTKLSLIVRILKLDAPGMGVTMITDTAARYELIDRDSGGLVFAADIDSQGRVGMGENFVGVVRARDSASRSVQNNIAQFLQQLEGADLTKPLFPGQPAPARAPE